MDENFLVDLARDTFLIFFTSFVKKLKLKSETIWKVLNVMTTS